MLGRIPSFALIKQILKITGVEPARQNSTRQSTEVACLTQLCLRHDWNGVMPLIRLLSIIIAPHPEGWKSRYVISQRCCSIGSIGNFCTKRAYFRVLKPITPHTHIAVPTESFSHIPTFQHSNLPVCVYHTYL